MPSIASVNFLVHDIDEALAFFTSALAFDVVADEVSVAVFEDLYGNDWDLIQPAS